MGKEGVCYVIILFTNWEDCVYSQPGTSVKGAAERYSEIPHLSPSQVAQFSHPVTHVHSIEMLKGLFVVLDSYSNNRWLYC